MTSKPQGELKKDFVEGYAAACWHILLGLGVQDGHSKTYDPMTIDEVGKVAHSYVFDLWDGGRHHHYENLEQIIEAVKKEAVSSLEAHTARVVNEVIETIWQKGTMWAEGQPCPDVSKLQAGDYFIISKNDLNLIRTRYTNQTTSGEEKGE